MISLARYLVVDHLIDAERSYRATLLGLRHGLDVIRLLREVAERDGDRALALWCEDTLVERESFDRGCRSSPSRGSPPSQT